MTLTDKVSAGYTNVTLRGGRITKWKGQAASYSPQLGTIIAGVSGTALATALALAGSSLIPAAALAGGCTAVTQVEFECSGGTYTQQTITSTGSIKVRTLPDFAANVLGTGAAISIEGAYATFTDLYASDIIGQTDALTVRGTGFFDDIDVHRAIDRI